MNVIRYSSAEVSRRNQAVDRDFIDIETIRRRVASIKNSWTPETVQARAVEGARRREQLESLVLDLLTDTSASDETCELKQHGFCLVV